MLNATNIVKMETVNKPPKHGYINDLAKLCGCNRQTVRTAIFENAKGPRADMVRKMYRTKYGNN